MLSVSRVLSTCCCCWFSTQSIALGATRVIPPIISNIPPPTSQGKGFLTVFLSKLVSGVIFCSVVGSRSVGLSSSFNISSSNTVFKGGISHRSSKFFAASGSISGSTDSVSTDSLGSIGISPLSSPKDCISGCVSSTRIIFWGGSSFSSDCLWSSEDSLR